MEVKITMDEFEKGFREGLRRIDTLASPVPAIDPGELTARARRATNRTTRPLRTWLAIAASVVVVAGVAVTGWLAARDRPIPAVPATAGIPASRTPGTSGTPALTVVTPAPWYEVSGGAVVVDDPALVDFTIAEQPEIPSAFFVDGGSIYVVDGISGQILTYREGRRVDTVPIPAYPIMDLVVWKGTYFLLGETLHAYARQGSNLVEVGLPDVVTGRQDIAQLAVDGEDVLAVTWLGQHYAVAGPNPSPTRPELTMVDDGYTVVDGNIHVKIPVADDSPSGSAFEPSGIHFLGRDDQHTWYLTYDSYQDDQWAWHYQRSVYEFSREGQLSAFYSLGDGDDVVPDREVVIGDGGVYQLRLTSRSVEIRRLDPTQPDGSSGPSDTATPLTEEEIASRLGSPPTGFRWETYTPGNHPSETAAVAVPSSWGHASSLDYDYCFAEGRHVYPNRPYVDDNHGTGQGHGINCAALTDAQQALHVSIADVDLALQSFPWNGNNPHWRQWSVALGRTVVTVTGQAKDAGLAQQILATARIVPR